MEYCAALAAAALDGVCIVRGAADERIERSDVVAMSAVSDIVNGWSGGVIRPAATLYL